MAARGVIYVATGAKYAAEAARSLATLRRHEPDLPVTLFTDVAGEHPAFTSVVRVENHRTDPRKVFHSKVEYIAHSPYEHTLLLDTDTHICGTLRQVFNILDRFEFAAALAPIRSPGRLRGVPLLVPDSFGQLNSGVLLFRKCARVDAMFADWLRRYEAHDFPKYFGDQEALREALWFSDLQLCILSPEWNCRFCFGVTVHGPVKILHGRHRFIDLVEHRINERPHGVRSFRTDDLEPEALRTWAQLRGVPTAAQR
jgi:hypothetical protein